MMQTPIPKNRKTPAFRRAPEEKQELLLSAAQELFSRQGFDATSTLQIAAKAGVSEGILFHHFGSKKGLFIRLAQDYARKAAAVTMPDDPTDVTEESVVRAAFDFAESNPALYQMLKKGSAELSELDIAAPNDIIIGTIAGNLVQGMRDGTVRQGNAEVMAQLQFAVVDAAYRAWRSSNDPASKEEYILEAVNCMIAMLAPSSPIKTR